MIYRNSIDKFFSNVFWQCSYVLYFNNVYFLLINLNHLMKIIIIHIFITCIKVHFNGSREERIIIISIHNLQTGICIDT